MRDKPDPVDAYVGGRLRGQRTLLGLSQGEIGARLGLSFQQIQKYERDTSRIGASRLYRPKVLGVSISYFFEDLPMELAATSKHRAAVIADDAIPTPREVRMLVRAYSRLLAALVRRHIVHLIKAVAWACSDGLAGRRRTQPPVCRRRGSGLPVGRPACGRHRPAATDPGRNPRSPAALLLPDACRAHRLHGVGSYLRPARRCRRWQTDSSGGRACETHNPAFPISPLPPALS